ncbi:MAG: 16S rRNA (uracil(1498)-N(3))-methyltransferase, partial [Spirochaetota bacterium]
SADELDGLIERGFSPLWLGPQVLRSESAALFAAAAMRILILERDWWQPATT